MLSRLCAEIGSHADNKWDIFEQKIEQELDELVNRIEMEMNNPRPNYEPTNNERKMQDLETRCVCCCGETQGHRESAREPCTF